MCEKSGGRHGVELEAAEALAALAHHIITTGENKGDATFAKDDSQRFSNPFKHTNESSTTQNDLSEVLKKNTNTIPSMVMHSKRDQQKLDRKRYGVHGSGSCIKSRNHLTEAEREERKIRRVLANRESARQTIRRRQAMYEELTKNAAGLAIESEDLKTKKEQALIKYNYLKSMNEQLKDLLDKASKAEASRIQCADPGLAPIKPPTSSTAPNLPCGQPSVFPFCWPPFFNNPHDDLEQGMDRSNGMGAQVYVLPFPWFFPLQMQCIVQNSHPSFQYLQRSDIQNAACMNWQSEGQLDQCHASNATKMNSEIPHPTMSACPGGRFGVAPEGTCKQSAENMAFKAPFWGLGASASPLPDLELAEEAASPSPSTWCLATKSETSNPSSSKTSSEAAAAAEARKRRKELTKLKTLYCRMR